MLSVHIILIAALLVLIMIGAAILQIYLSKCDHKILGLILPIIVFVWSMIYSIDSFEKAFYISFSPGAFFSALLLLVFYNIPTILLLVIYIHFRKRI